MDASHSVDITIALAPGASCCQRFIKVGVSLNGRRAGRAAQGGGGGGTASLGVGTQNKTTDPWLCVLIGLQPPVFEASKDSLLLLLLLLCVKTNRHKSSVILI